MVVWGNGRMGGKEGERDREGGRAVERERVVEEEEGEDG